MCWPIWWRPSGSRAAVHEPMAGCGLIHEDGTGPYLEEFRFDLPIYTGDGVLVVSTALPEFRRGAPAAGSLQIHVAGQEYRTEPLLDVDRYAATEFRAGYDSVVFKAVAGTVIRSLIQLEIQRQSREQGGLASVLNVVAPIASAVVTQADTRIWRALPRSIGVASLVRPDDGLMRISAGSGGGAGTQPATGTIRPGCGKDYSSGRAIGRPRRGLRH